MNFAERNAAWTGPRRHFQQLQTRNPKPGYWSIEVKGPDIFVWWGRLGGKEQFSKDTPGAVNVGKINEKSPNVYALERAREMARKKSEYEGYREFVTTGSGGAFLDPIIEGEIDFDDLAPSLSFYKPDNSMGAGIEKLTRAGGSWYTRKRNGMMKVLCCNTKGELNIYSRRMLRQHDDEVGSDYTWDDRFPHIIHAIEKHLPPKTILLGELVVEEVGPNVPTDEHRYAPIGRERFDLAQSYIKSLTPKAVKDMEDSQLWPFFYCWDVAFWGGQDLVKHMPMSERVVFIDTIEERTSCTHFEALVRMQFATPEDAIEYAKANGWEGFVVIDPHEMGYGDKAYNFKGKPDRPRKFCAKLKPEFEDDFIAIWDPDKGFGEKSSKESRGCGIKSVGLYQHNKMGELVFIANVSSGLTDELIEKNSHPRHWPQVWTVWYSGRRYITEGDDTNALDFPRIKTEDYLRTDKRPEECMNERL
jgi:hypothetical protein